MNCPNCNREIPDGTQYCELCGKAIAVSDGPARIRLSSNVVIPAVTGLGSLLGASFRIWWNNLLLIAKVALVVWLPVHVAVNLVLYAANAQESFGLNARIGMWLEMIFGTLTAPAILFAVLEKLRTGIAPPIGDCYRWGIRQWGRTFGNRFLSGVLICAGGLLLVIPGIILWVSFMLVDPIVAIEADEQSKVLTRSRDLTRGKRWMLLGGGLTMFVVSIVAVISLSLPFPDYWLFTAVSDCVNELFFALIIVLELVAYLAFVQAEGEAAEVRPVVGPVVTETTAF